MEFKPEINVRILRERIAPGGFFIIAIIGDDGAGEFPEAAAIGKDDSLM